MPEMMPSLSRHERAPFGPRLMDLRRDFTVYDAGYVALAETLEQPLLPCDAWFARAPRGTHTADVHTFPG